MNGELINGISFVMPDGDAIITDVDISVKGNITIDADSNIYTKVNKAFSNTTIQLLSKTYNVVSFKLNGETVTGDRFVMPEGDVNITDVVISTSVAIVESEHNPYLIHQYNSVYGEKKFEGAKSLTIVLYYQTEGTSWDWVYLYDSPTNTSTPVNNKKYGGKTRTTETITVNGDYVKIVFNSDSSASNYYGFKATITPNY